MALNEEEFFCIQNTNQEMMDFFSKLNHMRNSQELIDCTLRTEDGSQFPVHKVMLLASSKFFKTFVTTETKMPLSLVVSGVKSEVLKDVLDFIYFQPVEIPVANIWDVLAASEKFRFQSLTSQCHKHIINTMNVDNCALFYQSAVQCGLTKFQQSVKTYVIDNFAQIPLANQNLMQLSAENLQDILIDDRLTCNEKHLWRVIRDWLEKRPQERKNQAPNLLSCVRLGFLDTSFVFENIMRHPLIFSNLKCRHIISWKLDHMWDMAEMMTLKHVDTKYIGRPRWPKDLLFSVGARRDENGNVEESVEVYDNKADIWFEIHNDNVETLNNNRSDHACVVLDNCLYVIGGRDVSTGVVLKTVNCLDLQRKEWRTVPSMIKARYGMSVAVLPGMIVVIGGSLESHILYSVETFEPKDNRWTFLSCLKKPRCWASASVINNSIYVVGGTSNYKHSLKTAEVFRVNSSSWQQIANMKEARLGLSSVVSNGYIYVAGGSDLASVERYDPKNNLWTIVSQMKEPRTFFTLSLLDGEMYAFGGIKCEDEDEERSTQNRVESEFYDEENGCWRAISRSINGLKMSSACVANALPNIKDYLYMNRENVLEVKRKLLIVDTLKEKSDSEGSSIDLASQEVIAVPE